MTVLDLASRAATRAERIDRAVVGMHARLVSLIRGDEIHEVGHAIWTVSGAPFPFANGVIRYDASDFRGPASERELDNCLAAMSTYDIPWRFSAWAHLGGDLLVARLIDRGMVERGTEVAMWRDLPAAETARPTVAPCPDDIEVRQAADPSGYRAWTRAFTRANAISGDCADMVGQMVAGPQSISLVARGSRRPVGCLSLTIDRGLALVQHLGVVPTARRRGVARRLLRAAHEVAAAHGAQACVALANPEAAGLCAGLGHHAVTSVTYLSPPAPRVGMALA